MIPRKVEIPIAPCGINCSACFVFLRERNKCPGCRVEDLKKPVTRLKCSIKTCSSRNSEFCFTCREYPCSKLERIDKRYRTKYNLGLIGNLETIAINGLENFLETEKQRWSCPSCGGTVSIHKGRCVECGGRK
jgi:hypothetical protein